MNKLVESEIRKGSWNETKTDVGILLVLLLTDGCVFRDRFLIFHNKSESLHSLFEHKLRKLFQQKKFTRRLEKNGVKRTQVSSKELVLRLRKLADFKRKVLPKFVVEMPKSEICKILQVLFSTDGSISLAVRWHKRNKSWEIRRRIEFSCKNPNFRSQVFRFLQLLGFKPVASGGNITLEKKCDIRRFASKIKFVQKAKVGGDSKNWKGFDKNQILVLSLKTLKFKKHNLERFGTKEDVINFLKSRL